MTTTLSPDPELEVRATIRVAPFTSGAELAGGRRGGSAKTGNTVVGSVPSTAFEQGLGLSDSPEELALRGGSALPSIPHEEQRPARQEANLDTSIRLGYLKVHDASMVRPVR